MTLCVDMEADNGFVIKSLREDNDGQFTSEYGAQWCETSLYFVIDCRVP